jgi:hypothetical protein
MTSTSPYPQQVLGYKLWPTIQAEVADAAGAGFGLGVKHENIIGFFYKGMYVPTASRSNFLEADLNKAASGRARP